MNKLILALALAVSSVAVAAEPTPATPQPTTPAPTTPPTSTPPATSTTPPTGTQPGTMASLRATGVVKSIDLVAKTITVNTQGADVVLSLGSMTLPTEVRVGSTVDITYKSASGVNTATAVTPRG